MKTETDGTKVPSMHTHPAYMPDIKWKVRNYNSESKKAYKEQIGSQWLNAMSLKLLQQKRDWSNLHNNAVKTKS